MIKRIITSIVSICVLLPVLYLSDTIVLPIALSLFGAIALYEMFKCIGKSKNLLLCTPMYILAIAAPFLLKYQALIFAPCVVVFMIFVLVYYFLLCILSKGNLTFESIGEFFTVSLYIIASFNAILYIRNLENGKYIYLLIFIGAWVTDIFAYFSGMFFGKHKLIPDVSPKKTIEGSIGGILFCIISFVAFGLIIKAIDKSVVINYCMLIVAGLLVSIVSQIGDLIMSVVKRKHGIKDYGKLFPGHGGVLDRFDSILAVSLILCAICVLLNSFGIIFIGGVL